MHWSRIVESGGKATCVAYCEQTKKQSTYSFEMDGTNYSLSCSSSIVCSPFLSDVWDRRDTKNVFDGISSRCSRLLLLLAIFCLFLWTDTPHDSATATLFIILDIWNQPTERTYVVPGTYLVPYHVIMFRPLSHSDVSVGAPAHSKLVVSRYRE